MNAVPNATKIAPPPKDEFSQAAAGE